MKINRVRHGAALGGVLAACLMLAACGSSFDDKASAQKSDHQLTVLIASSGDAEAKAVKDAVAAWSKQSGTKAQVLIAADLPQQLSQGFAANTPPDVFYLAPDQVATYAANGSLYAYGSELPNANAFYPSLTKAFTVDGKLQCAPKDFSTLGLVINDKLWKAAGLTDADIPTTWPQLAAVAAKLTKGKVVGLTMNGEIARIGAFFPEAGGSFTNADGTKATINSPQNLEALKYVQGMLKSGDLKFAADLGTGWGGEAFGKQLAAMTIEGNWLTGAMSTDYPNVKYSVSPLPSGPAGKGTLAFTNCWGISKASDHQKAVDLVEYLTSAEQQIKFADAFGVIPSVQAAAEKWASANPSSEPFVKGAEYAQTLPSQPGTADVITDFNSQLTTLKDGDPKTMLTSVQQTLQAALDGQR